MKWFRIFLVAAVVSAVVGIGIWSVYGLTGTAMSEGATTIALSAGFLALVLGGAAFVSAANRSKN